jgi:hypothetical protein
VARGGYTTAERYAWVDDQVADLQEACDRATVVEIVRSLGASVRLAYTTAGATG